MRMLGQLPASQFLKWFGVIPSSPFYALVFIMVCFFYIVWGLRKNEVLSNKLLFYTTLIVFVNSILLAISPVDTTQGIFYFLSHFMIFNTILSIHLSKDELKRILKLYINFGFFTGLIAIAFVVIYFIIPSRYNRFDTGNAIFWNSHISAIYFFFIFLVSIFYYKKYPYRFSKIIQSVLFVAFFVGFNEKYFGLIFGLFSLKILYSNRRNVRLMTAAAIFVMIGGTFVYGFISNRMGVIEKIIKDIPVVVAYKNVANVSTKYVYPIFLGTGFGQYGTVVAYKNILSKSPPPLAKEYNYGSLIRVVDKDKLPSHLQGYFTSSLLLKINTFASAMAEFGLVVYFFYMLILYKIISYALRFRSSNLELKSLMNNIGIYLISLILYAHFIPSGSLDNFVALVPALMVMAVGFKINKNEEHD